MSNGASLLDLSESGVAGRLGYPTVGPTPHNFPKGVLGPEVDYYPVSALGYWRNTGGVMLEAPGVVQPRPD